MSFRNLAGMAKEIGIDVLALDPGSDDPTSRFRVRKDNDSPDTLPYMG